MDRDGNIYGIMNGPNYGRDPYERQERREYVRDAMERENIMRIERDMIEREMVMREPMIIENPENHRSIEVYEKERPSRFEEPLRPRRLDYEEPKSDYPHPNRNSALRNKRKYRSPTERESSNENPLREARQGSSLRRKRSLSREHFSPETAAMLVEEKFYEN